MIASAGITQNLCNTITSNDPINRSTDEHLLRRSLTRQYPFNNTVILHSQISNEYRSECMIMTYENLDPKLVNALLDDGRTSLRNLAEELDVSVTTVSNHLRDLEEEGVIEGYTPRVNYDALGYDVTGILQLKVEGRSLTEVSELLESQRQIISVYETTGDHDVTAVGKFRDTDDMNTQIKALLQDVDIRESNTSVTLNVVTENEQFELDLNE